MADVVNQAVQGGHVVKIMAGGKIVGFGRTAQMGQNYGTEGVYCIGAIGPQEHVPLRWDAQITLDQFVIHKKKLGEAVQLMNLAPHGPDEVLEAGVLNLEILDDQDNTMMVYQECTIANHSYNVTANQFSGQNATFLAKNVQRGAHDWQGSPVGIGLAS